jgi:hypothetical protein
MHFIQLQTLPQHRQAGLQIMVAHWQQPMRFQFQVKVEHPKACRAQWHPT